MLTVNVQCRGCMEFFVVAAESNALALDADLCYQCILAKQTLAQIYAPRPLEWHWTRAGRKQKLSNLFAGVLIGLCLMAVILICGWFLVGQ